MGSLHLRPEADWNAEQMELIKSQIAKGCTDGELGLFAEVCKKTGLNPFTRQIYAISRKGRMTIQMSIDGFRSIAASSGLYNGSETFWCGADGAWVDCWLGRGNPVAAKTMVYRGASNPFTAVCLFSEYKGGEMWSKFPATMIGKCSEAAALRKAFPESLSGYYSTEEMDQSTETTQEPDSFASRVTGGGYEHHHDVIPSELPGKASPDILGEDTKNPGIQDLRNQLRNLLSGYEHDQKQIFIAELGNGQPKNWTFDHYIMAVDKAKKELLDLHKAESEDIELMKEYVKNDK